MNPSKNFDQAVFDRLKSGILALGDEHDKVRQAVRATQLCHAIVALTAVQGLSESQSQRLLLQVDPGRRPAL
jgi:hypothetical protein